MRKILKIIIFAEINELIKLLNKFHSFFFSIALAIGVYIGLELMHDLSFKIIYYRIDDQIKLTFEIKM